MEHTDLIRLHAENKTEAMAGLIEFLHCYGKEKIRVRSIEGSQNYYEIFVSYVDKYEEDPVFITEDFKDIDAKKLTYENN